MRFRKPTCNAVRCSILDFIRNNDTYPLEWTITPLQASNIIKESGRLPVTLEGCRIVVEGDENE
jgi:hypothetical protein